MPLIEIATVRLLPSFSPALPASFTTTWTHALELASSRAGVPFRLYRSTSNSSVYYMLGGWRTGEDHIAFVSTPDAVELAKSIGKFMTVDIVRHVDGDFTKLEFGQEHGERPKNVRVGLHTVPETSADEWEREWHERQADGPASGGWDLSASVQKQHRAFKQMAEATNSTSAFGGSDQGNQKTWVWVEVADSCGGFPTTNDLAAGDDIEGTFFEMEYVLG